MERSRNGRHGLYDLNAALFMMCVQPPESRWHCSSFAWIIDSNVNGMNKSCTAKICPLFILILFFFFVLNGIENRELESHK